MSKILVTGSAGFIGSHLVEKLLELNCKIIGVDNFDNFYSRDLKKENLRIAIENPNYTFIEADITTDECWNQLKNKGIEIIIHLAAKAGVLPSIEDPKAYSNTNIFGTQLLLDFMKEGEIKKLIFASSSSVYGNNRKTPFSESDVVDFPISPYAYTKKTGELLIHTYYYLYQIDAICLRFFTVFGPRQRPDLAIRKFVDKILNDEAIEMYGDGTTARDYTFIDDIIGGIIKAFGYLKDNKDIFEVINLGNKNPIQLNELIKVIYELLGKKPNVLQTAMKPGDVNITFADIKKANDLLDYKPKTSLANGIGNFIDWYKK